APVHPDQSTPARSGGAGRGSSGGPADLAELVHPRLRAEADLAVGRLLRHVAVEPGGLALAVESLEDLCLEEVGLELGVALLAAVHDRGLGVLVRLCVVPLGQARGRERERAALRRSGTRGEREQSGGRYRSHETPSASSRPRACQAAPLSRYFWTTKR